MEVYAKVVFWPRHITKRYVKRAAGEGLNMNSTVNYVMFFVTWFGKRFWKCLIFNLIHCLDMTEIQLEMVYNQTELAFAFINLSSILSTATCMHQTFQTCSQQLHCCSWNREYILSNKRILLKAVAWLLHFCMNIRMSDNGKKVHV